MPHLTIDCSSSLAGLFERSGLLGELHRLVLQESRSQGVCKTWLRPALTYVGENPERHTSLVHVEVGLLAGRSNALKDRLADRIVELLHRHLSAAGRRAVIISAEVRDLASSYRLVPHHTAQRRVH
ncbi:5-carboxymethyl-2-hydroxymuconate Delta-isomerase [Streptomyces sp. NPDC059374]|uniref:5-carboxymethyl-2-hydroxymuconate Delta-isomerase n=1 Tax=Streptomyces sp. NPDC059374 TaxID=3346814 RepID=UPI00368B07A8